MSHDPHSVEEPFTVYYKQTCPWCHEALEYLNEHGYALELVDVKADPANYKELEKISGQTSVPTLITAESKHLLPDFDVDQLEEFLNKHNLKK